MKRIILLGLTTGPRSDWRKKFEEIKKFNIEEIALFPTFLKEKEEREELYKLLNDSPLKSIPHVHLRDGMDEEEVNYFLDKYKTKVFNIHVDRDYEAFLNMKRLKGRLFLENLEILHDNFETVLKSVDGICLDISHFHDFGLKQGLYKHLPGLMDKYGVGCCHISAITSHPYLWTNKFTNKQYELINTHYLTELSELDYVKDYIKYLPKYISIELENSFEEQLEAKKYLEKIINNS